ncbi:Ethanolamine kinase [Terramyces sp. JEL0728]|nr:Ethanolamine kinase [Terramyces sp. JEL0728]
MMEKEKIQDDDQLSSYSTEADLAHFDLTINPEFLLKDTQIVVNAFFSDWTENDIKLSRCTDGTTNQLVKATHKETKQSILIRTYGRGTSVLIDRNQEILNIRALSLEGLCPPLYGSFNNGIVYGYVDGLVYTIKDMLDGKKSKLIAKAVAKWHNSMAVPNAKPQLFTTMWKWANAVPQTYSNSSKQERLKKSGYNLNLLREELVELQSHLEKLESPVVFCHNDLNAANLIYNPEKDCCSLIDYEYGCHSYRGFDIGNFFCEFGGIECDFTKYPNEQIQKEWIKEYLKEKDGQDIISDNELHTIYREVLAFSLASHFFWSLWALHIFMPNNQLHKTLTDYKCADLINPESSLFQHISHYGAVPAKPITLGSSISVREACHTLATSRITSAPILDGSQLIGQLDYFDLVLYLLQALNNITLANMDEPEWTVKDILSHVITTSDPLSSLTTHKKLVGIQQDAPLLDVLDEFIRSKCHRLAVFDGAAFNGVVSQSSLVALVVHKFGLKKEKGVEWDLGNKSIKELGVIRKNVIFVNEKNTVIDALYRMHVHQISSVAIIENGVLRGSIGLSDIKLILAEPNGVKLLTNSCKQFFQEIRKKQSLDHAEDTRVPNYVVGPETTLIFAMEKMIATHSHRVWVVENHDKVVGLLSISDCIPLLRS